MTMQLYAYKITLKHDKGTVAITTAASDEDQAVRMVLAAEHAPKRAVLSVVCLRSIVGNYGDGPLGRLLAHLEQLQREIETTTELEGPLYAIGLDRGRLAAYRDAADQLRALGDRERWWLDGEPSTEVERLNAYGRSEFGDAWCPGEDETSTV